MSTALKDHFGIDVAERIAAMLAGAWPEFDASGFLTHCRDGYDDLELTPRARHIAAGLTATLPRDFARAADIVEASLGPRQIEEEPQGGMASFLYLPHVYWVVTAGMDTPERALHLQRELTQRFTAEFSIRAYITHHYQLTMQTLAEWALHPDGHVRRLVSEGTRTRLPWAGRLPMFQTDPAPVVELLELLKDDPSSYVRRSVANNLNDISKDNPDVTLAVCTRWAKGASAARQALIRHALRGLLKAGNPRALALVGAGGEAQVTARDLHVDPPVAAIGQSVTVHFLLEATGRGTATPLVQLRVHYITRRGGTAPKVFSLGQPTLAAGDAQQMRRSVSLRQMTTRTHFPGPHRVELVINGVAEGATQFEVTAEPR